MTTYNRSIKNLKYYFSYSKTDNTVTYGAIFTFLLVLLGIAHLPMTWRMPIKY